MAEQFQVGWREWLALPELGLDRIKAKIDTGARTSCLHAFEVTPFKKNGEQWVEFWIHPHQNDTETTLRCEAKVKDSRVVTDSGGHRERRFVIESMLEIADHRWPIEITLTNRDSMKFRMLLGRTAMNGRIIVDPAASFLTGQ
ncbi:ATP-dependent zinc protease [Pseudoalteromonas xiamenensis]|uniref:ATP-dependent zinc protease n=1 Tax=Pseudoalteromonas xiamenensis TaxID=882626 RepID=A0A975HM45_9GAMM|nr:ATP-dependent zinc protease [Pseudoalteromonas xiamenensis]QTH72758.1 ATP-dependent zinc protease [Pseudoalteromonas xiamenensis]